MRTKECLPSEFRARTFGRKGMGIAVAATRGPTLADDVKLFAMTFVGGFLFVSLYLA